MYHLLHKHTGKAVMAVFCLMFISITTTAQTISINSSFNADSEIYPFGSSGTVYGLSINGTVNLYSDSSLVRIVLIDNLFNELLVYEAYQYISPESPFEITNECDETCYSNGFVPYSIQIQVTDASIEIFSLDLRSSLVPDGLALQQQAKQALELQKVAYINSDIALHKMLWFADTNSISQLNYQQKKALFGDNYNLLGLDYYVGGIYDPTPDAVREIASSALIPEWDWRTRHGANDPNKSNFYYSGDENGKQGWMTQIKNQGVWTCNGLCYIYAPLGAMEAVANLYYNTRTHKDYDLSIQNVLECDEYEGVTFNGNWIGQCKGGYTLTTSDFVMNNPLGVFQEAGCYERQHQPDNDCRESDFQGTTQYMFDYFSRTRMTPVYSPVIDEVKINLIQKGPMCITALNYGGPDNEHSMVLAGFGRIDIGDIFHLENSNTITVEEGNEYIGQMYWIYKDSYGVNSGLDGYRYHINTENHPVEVIYYKPPFSDLKLSTQLEPEVHDLDNDGYINWGIDDNYQPEGAIKDSDDSEPRLGPFDENYFSVPVAPVIVVKQGGYTIHQNGFYSFYDDTLSAGSEEVLTFTIINAGTAQLNLISNVPFGQTVTLSNYTESDFSVESDTLNSTIPMEGGSTSFDIRFTLHEPITEPKIATVTIHLNESDMEDFVFNIVFVQCTTNIPTEPIQGLTPWDGILIKLGDVIVEADAVLTITGNVAFTQGANLFIEKGGQVIIDGGHLTALCNSWPGVDVWGDKTKSQFYHFPEVKQEQGVIKMINGGKISYADNAIETIRYVDDRPDPTTSGGIVSIRDGSINNCTNGVVFYPYKNFYPTVSYPQENWSNFYKAGFTNDQVVPHSLILFDGVDGISVKGCSFKNSLPVIHNQFYKARAINSYNSSFRVSELTMPDPNDPPIPTTIKGFEHGIYAIAGTYSGYIHISTSVFEDNERGIYLCGISNPVIVQNEFWVRTKYSKFEPTVPLIGLYMDAFTTGFTVEENTFYSTVGHTDLKEYECIGITVNNTGHSPNELYNNNLKNLTIGVEAIGENRDAEGAGLCIKCNDFADCVTDIYIDPGGQPAGSPIGIAKEQGIPNEPSGSDPTIAAGNIFSRGNESNFNNHVNCGYVKYTHHNRFETSRVWPELSSNIVLYNDLNAHYEKDISCPSNIGNGTDPILEKSTLSTENIKIAAYSDTLALETDGGSTEQLNLDVAVSAPNQAMQLRQQLLDESPFLSDTVIKSAIDKENVLPNAMIRDVLTANPQSAKIPDILQLLDDRYVQMPDYMISEIMLGKNYIGAKELIERQLVTHETKYSKSLVKLERYYKTDTINPLASTDSLVALWNNQPYPVSKYKLAFHYLNNNDSTATFNTLDNIPVEFDLTLKGEDTHQQYNDLFNILWQTNHDTIEFDSTHFQSLLDISTNSKTLPGVYAKNILIHEGLIIYDEPVYFPDYFKSVNTSGNWTKAYKTEDFLKVFPNPAGTYFTVEHNIILYEGECSIIISDIHGKTVSNYNLNSAQNQHVISTNDYPSGLYLVQLFINGVIKETEKLSISK